MPLRPLAAASSTRRSPGPRAAWALVFGMLAAATCGGDAGEAAPGSGAGPVAAELPPRPGSARHGSAEAARAGVDALLAAPSAGSLLAVLGQSHAVARELLGRHTLRTNAEFSLIPAASSRPVVDQPVLLTQEVKDELVLQWGSGPGEPVRMYLSQSTDKHRGREVMVIDEQVYTRLLHRGWHVRPLDADLHMRWLDEAQRGVHDLVAFAAPALAVAAVEEGELVRVELSRAAAADPSQIAAGRGREWRQRAEITAVEGQIVLQRATGLWQSAELRVRYDLKDELERPLVGETHLTGRVELTPDLEIRPPEHVQPLPERVRHEAERRRLLEGLAGT